MGNELLQASKRRSSCNERKAVGEYDLASAEAYKTEIEASIAVLEMEALQLDKQERSTKDEEVAALQNERKYIDACRIAEGLEPSFGYFVNKLPLWPGLSHDELKELEDFEIGKCSSLCLEKI